jgi:hypothetical protein
MISDDVEKSLGIAQRNTIVPIPSQKLTLWITFLLISSGVFHLLILIFNGAEWNGPLSPRKPALFGFSAGLTLWSIDWVVDQIKPHVTDKVLVRLMGLALIVEVVLITLQYWRGVASHFNNTTTFNTSIEQAILILILFIMLEIFYFTVRTLWLSRIDEAMIFAIRRGMLLLSLSCIIGVFISVIGHINIINGKSYEVWGGSGTLKFPHGAALHAIQLLPFLAWLARQLMMSKPIQLVKLAFASQMLFLIYAIWQTANGRARFDFDMTGGFILIFSMLLAVFVMMRIILAVILKSKIHNE